MKTMSLKKIGWFGLTLFFFIFCSFQQKKKVPGDRQVIIKILFKNNVNGQKIVLNDSAYTNPFGEKYRITKLRYYVTNVGFQNGNNVFKEKNSYHLVDESIPETQVIKLSVPAGEYNSINFLLGVDSLHNVSGAQTDDLDPAKDMFWTWNSGYVMAKLEGNSPDSKLVNNKIAYHIGGFSGPYNVLKEIQLNFPGKMIRLDEGKTYQIIIDAEINIWWHGNHDFKFSGNPAITTPGENAHNMSDNYANMFHIEKLISDQQ
jgi:hypothetical protein